MNSVITRWNMDPLYDSGFPLAALAPFSPVHKHRKFSTVLGQMSARSVISKRPAGLFPIAMSK